MAVDVRTVAQLSEQLRRPEKAVLATLNELGVVVVDGLYNHGRYEAALTEPKWLRNKRNEWSLSHATGLGAIKYILDPLKINIVQHHMCGPNFLMLEGASRKRAWVKVHYRNTWIKQKSRNTAHFECKGFGADDAPEHYLFVCLEEPMAWHFTRTQLRDYANYLKGSPPRYVDGVISRWGDRQAAAGGLHFWLNEDCPSVLTDAAVLGI